MLRSLSCVGSMDKRLEIRYQNENGRIEFYLATGGNRAGGFTSGIERIFSFVVLGLAGSSVNTRTDVAPSTVVQRLLLQTR